MMSYFFLLRYYHVRDEATIEKIIRNKELWSSILPRLQIPEEILDQFPEEARQSILWGRHWAVVSDGEYHTTLRSTFPKQYPVLLA